MRVLYWLVHTSTQRVDSLYYRCRIITPRVRVNSTTPSPMSVQTIGSVPEQMPPISGYEWLYDELCDKKKHIVEEPDWTRLIRGGDPTCNIYMLYVQHIYVECDRELGSPNVLRMVRVCDWKSEWVVLYLKPESPLKYFLLLLSDKPSVKYNSYVWISVWWKTKI